MNLIRTILPLYKNSFETKDKAFLAWDFRFNEFLYGVDAYNL